MSKARDLGDAANKANFLDNVTADIQPQLTPAGTIITFGSSSAPSGYLPCEGQVLVRADYLALFTAIGVTWNTGGETGAQFRVPDLRGAFLRGTGSHGTQNMADGNDYAGPSVGSFENDQFQGHYHNVRFKGNDAAFNQSGVQHHEGTTNRYHEGSESNSSLQAKASITDGTNGTPRTGDETRPFNAGILYCIKT